MPMAWCNNGDRGYDCASNHVCDENYGNPEYDKASFDNIGNSVLIVIGIMSCANW